MLKKDQQLLLKLARNTLESYFKDLDPDTSECTHLTQLKGCFVTLHKGKELRGCIGFIKPIMPLFEQIIAATKAAAFEDPRFEPLVEEELKQIRIEISILSKPELIKASSQQEYFENIKIGRDGLIIQSNGHSGLLLPQVAVEYHWTPEQFLQAVCDKAGLDIDAWKRKDTKIYKFQAEVFGE
ncbi:TPA: AmmeMemoRadiSam system protein A [bacterium]|nr:AmmeMemoRadiSam system protein A [bacterium]